MAPIVNEYSYVRIAAPPVVLGAANVNRQPPMSGVIDVMTGALGTVAGVKFDDDADGVESPTALLATTLTR